MQFIRKIIWIWALLITKTRAFSHVGHRTTYKGQQNNYEVTVIVRETDKPDLYSREELLKLLKLIRVNEERMQWSVPEPVRCGYCGHCSPTDENGLCPVIIDPNITTPAGVRTQRKHFPCSCPTHAGGLEKAMVEALGKIYPGRKRPDSDFTISPAAASSEALNG